MLGRQLTFKTSRQHYKGRVVYHLFSRRGRPSKYDLKITEVIKGNKKIGDIIRVSGDKCL